MESLAEITKRIEDAVSDGMRTGKASEGDIRRVLFALSLAGWTVTKKAE